MDKGIEELRLLNTRKDVDLDSIELGTPGKGGRIKIYINTKEQGDNAWKAQIDSAVEALEYLKEKMEGSG